MALLIGTRNGVFRSDEPLDDAEHVLDAGATLRVRTFDGDAYAATTSGLYRSVDEGRTWTDLDVPREEVYSVVASPNGEYLYAGTHPAHLYVSSDVRKSDALSSRSESRRDSDDDGETWEECDGFQDLPSRDEWHTPRHRDEAHVRSLGTHADAPDRVIAGVEVGGVHVSEDRGETWTERREGVHDDVHHVLVIDSETYVASTGGGLYRTRDAGRSWARLDGDVAHGYFREAFAFDGTFYAAAARDPPPSWGGDRGADAALFESSDGGDTLDAVDYPGAPEEFVLAWSEWDGRVVAGTTGGRVLARDSDGWTTLGHVPADVRSLMTA